MTRHENTVDESASSEGPKYITVAELLTKLEGRVCRGTLYRSIADGTLPSVRISPRRILVPADVLNRMLKNGQ